jgi:hypothetical protein
VDGFGVPFCRGQLPTDIGTYEAANAEICRLTDFGFLAADARSMQGCTAARRNWGKNFARGIRPAQGKANSAKG